MGLFKAKSVPARAGPVPTRQLLGLRGSPGCHGSGGRWGHPPTGGTFTDVTFLGMENQSGGGGSILCTLWTFGDETGLSQTPGAGLGPAGTCSERTSVRVVGWRDVCRR